MSTTRFNICFQLLKGHTFPICSIQTADTFLSLDFILNVSQLYVTFHALFWQKFVLLRFFPDYIDSRKLNAKVNYIRCSSFICFNLLNWQGNRWLCVSGFQTQKSQMALHHMFNLSISFKYLKYFNFICQWFFTQTLTPSVKITALQFVYIPK